MGCNHLSDCQRCSHIVQDLEDLVKDLEEEIKRLYDDLKAERIALERTVSSIKRSRDEWPLRSRWVRFSERFPDRGDVVPVRDLTRYHKLELAWYRDLDWWVFGLRIRESTLTMNWEWLEVREKGGE